MPVYPLINKVTGERQELSLTIDEYEKWKIDNPDWSRDWSAGVASSISNIGEWKDKVPTQMKEKLQKIKTSYRHNTIDI